jgi:hypothetical protein
MRITPQRRTAAPDRQTSASLIRPARVAAAGVCALGFVLAGAVAPTSAATHYAKVKRVCSRPRAGRAGCLVLSLAPAPAGAAGALPYVAGAGAVSTGPAGGLTPADLASAYRFSPTLGGGEQTVAIVDAFDDPNIESDLATFDSHYGLAACTTSDGCFAKVGQTGSSSSLPAADKVGWSVEIALDVEAVHSVCSGCRILLVEASSESFADLGSAVDEAVALGATEVSNSYGGLEGSVPEAQLAAYDHPGLPIVAASGDSGYLDWDFVFEGGAAPEVPDVPASLPWVVSVGGTSLKLSSTGARSSETVWNNSGRPSVEEFKQLAASGGGCSTLYTAPAWQQSAPGWGSSTCGTKRLDNDVAAVADPYTGFDIYDSYVYQPEFKPGWLTVGGTSLSAPLISAMYGLDGGGHGVGYPAQTLYTHLGQAAAVFDVRRGGNGYCDGEEASKCGEPEINELVGTVDCVGTTACDAALGFDGPTGVGAPNGLGAFRVASQARPMVVTGAATSIEATAAVVGGSVNPNGATVGTCAFEYGPTTSYGLTAPCVPSPGSGTSPVPVSAHLSGLTPTTAYHYRVSATNAFGTGRGVGKTFKTP